MALARRARARWWPSSAAATATCGTATTRSTRSTSRRGGRQSGAALHHPRHRLGHPGRRHAAGGPGLRLGLAGHGPAQRRRAAVAGHPVHQADPDRVHPPRHGGLHAAAGQRRSTGPTTASTRPTTRGPTSSSRRSRPTSASPSTTWCRSTSPGFQDAVNALGGIYLELPLPGQGRLLGPQHHDARAASCSSGAQALAVARARHYEYYANGYWQYDGTSDFGRIQRQDVFIKALIDVGQVEGEPADGQRLHRLHPRGRHHRRRLRLQRADRPGPRPTTPSTRPTCRARRCPPWRPTGSAAWATC